MTNQEDKMTLKKEKRKRGEMKENEIKEEEIKPAPKPKLTPLPLKIILNSRIDFLITPQFIDF